MNFGLHGVTRRRTFIRGLVGSVAIGLPLAAGARTVLGNAGTAGSSKSATSPLLKGGSTSQSSNPSAPTIVLVHGAFADSSSWNAVTPGLLDQGYPVVAAANP